MKRNQPFRTALKHRTALKRRTALTAVAVLSLFAAGTAGCVKQTKIPIVAERSSSAAPESGQEGALPADGSAPTMGDLIQTLAETPERYQANISEKSLKITSDAALDIPMVSRIPIIEIENAPYDREHGESALALFKEQTGVTQWDPLENAVVIDNQEIPPDTYVMVPDTENSGSGEYYRTAAEDYPQSYTSSDGKYSFSFAEGQNPDHTPMIWLESLVYSDGYSDKTDPNDLSDLSVTGTARSSLEAALKDQADGLLQNLSLASFDLKSSQWRRLSRRENGPMTSTDEYGLRLTYVSSFEGIPTVNRNSGWISAPMAPCQYVEFLYHEDGTLLRVKDINQERVTSNLGYEEFLMPFDAIAQIFEQYLRYYQTVYKPEPLSSGFSEWFSDIDVKTLSPDQSPYLSVTVTGVQFGFQLTYDDWDESTLSKGSGKGRLVPVWAFYGIPEAGSWQSDPSVSTSGWLVTKADSDRLLVTVNAVDGTVYGKE